MTDLNKAVQTADHVWERESVYVSAVVTGTNSSSNSIEVEFTTINERFLKIEAMLTKNNFDKNRRKLHNCIHVQISGGREEEVNKGEKNRRSWSCNHKWTNCWHHFKFGDKAEKCEQ